MIYEYPNQDAPLRQGDIFMRLPRVDMSLKHVPVVTAKDAPVDMAWDEIVRQGKAVTAILALKPVAAIIASQDCDAEWAPDITLCEIGRFREIERKSEKTTSLKKWIGIITQQARLNQKWFYLPRDERIGFGERMGVDFHMTIRVPREELAEMRHLRPGRLNDIVTAHFRERIAEFFRRYAYNEWYPLSPGEMAEYRKDYPDADPYPWQLVPRITEE